MYIVVCDCAEAEVTRAGGAVDDGVGSINYHTTHSCANPTLLPSTDAAVGEVCTNSQGYQLCVAKAVEAVEGGSANLTCRFAFPESKKPSSISVIWRIGNFLGHSIFENTDNRTFVDELFANRLTLMGNPDKGEASIQIREVRRSDQNTYYCRIMLHTESQEMPFEITKGTNLIIQDAGIGEICNSLNSYEVCVERAVEAVEGGSTILPCRFAFPESEKPSSISVIWRIGKFIRESIFERTDNQTHVHELFTNRLTLVGNPDKHEASLQINGVRHSDQNTYSCRIILHMESQEIPFEIMEGTDLVIQDACLPSSTTYGEAPSQLLNGCVHTLALALLATITLLLICANFISAIVFVRGFETRDTLDEV
ncbi:sialic acid-binding Ig-like lectin 12 [Petromyzon marinus]|uniref:sialic acid-binding Ig-like lectin 12 n=1 Tax=Petromyzon marinus TaxID=7757 RepID=UPI003F703640